MTSQPLELEGTWEEIVTHASELSGRRVRVTVLPDKSTSSGELLSYPTGEDNWQEEPFVGLWQDREDLKDSTAWVRTTRQQEWQS